LGRASRARPNSPIVNPVDPNRQIQVSNTAECLAGKGFQQKNGSREGTIALFRSSLLLLIA
jgi:hypothetical protein